MSAKRIVIAGGSGFIGTALAREFIRQEFDVVVLTRSPRTRADAVRELAWDGKTAGAWAAELDGATAVINLTGKNINCSHTPENLRDLITSRVDSVQALATVIGSVRKPPTVWVQASATGYYGDTQDQICHEMAPAGSNALAGICQRWEAAFHAAQVPETRKVILRIGVVLGREGGALPVLSQITRLFLGGAVGSGRQYLSWIHLDDLVRMFAAAMADEHFSGTYNAVAPNAVTNAEFMRELRQVLHRPWSPPVPVFAVRIGSRLLGSEATLALMSSRCEPERLRASGFKFQFPTLPEALADLC